MTIENNILEVLVDGFVSPILQIGDIDKISEFGRRHLETPFSGPRDSDFPAGSDFGPGPVIQLGLDLVTRILPWRKQKANKI